MRISELKMLIEKAYETADTLYETPHGRYFASRGIAPFRQLLMIDLIKWVGYLANVKGYATEREVVFYRMCYNEPVAGIRQAQAAMDSNLEGIDFGRKVPFLLSAFLLIDEDLYARGVDLKGTASDLYIDLLKSIGICFVEYKDSVDSKEERTMYEYIGLLAAARKSKLPYIIETGNHQMKDESSDSHSVVDERKETLLKSFDTIKDEYNNSHSMSDIVIKMFEIDIDTAIDMWTHLLNTYEIQAIGYSYDLTGAIISGGARIIGQEVMDDLILQNVVLKKVILTKKRAIKHSGTEDFIRRLIEKNQLQVVDEILQSIYDNPEKVDTWFDIMSAIMPHSHRITREAYDFLDMWCDKVDTKAERAKLSVRMLDYID